MHALWCSSHSSNHVRVPESGTANDARALSCRNPALRDIALFPFFLLVKFSYVGSSFVPSAGQSVRISMLQWRSYQGQTRMEHCNELVERGAKGRVNPSHRRVSRRPITSLNINKSKQTIQRNKSRRQSRSEVCKGASLISGPLTW